MRFSVLIGIVICLFAQPAITSYEVADDNAQLRGTERCGYAVIDYYQATNVLQALLPQVRLRPVKVAIIDDGIDQSLGIFDDINVTLLDPVSLLTDPHGHGTAVASLIAADNDSAGNNGIASRFLGSNLSLVVGRAFDNRSEVPVSEVSALPEADRSIAHVIATINRIRAAIGEGATIINISFGSWDVRDGRRPAGIHLMQREWANLIRDPANDHVLFIAASANHPFELTGGNDVPAGHDADNFITVGGVDSCDPMSAWDQSAYGNQIDLAAPAQIYVTARNPGGPGVVMQSASGNSYATPVITAIAALVQSITGLRGAELKSFLMDNANVLPTADRIGGKRPTLLKTVAAAMLTQYPANAEIISIMDSMGGSDGNPDPVGYMINRLRGNALVHFQTRTGVYNVVPATANLTGENIVFTGHFPFDTLSGRIMQNMGIMMGPGTTIGFNAGPQRLTLVLAQPFALGRRYAIDAREVGALSQLVVAGTRQFTGGGVTGFIQFDDCEMTHRSLPLNWFSNPEASGSTDRFVFITVGGSYDVTLEGMINTTPPESAAYQVLGGFTLPVMITTIDSTLHDYLEHSCAGGFQQP